MMSFFLNLNRFRIFLVVSTVAFEQVNAGWDEIFSVNEVLKLLLLKYYSLLTKTFFMTQGLMFCEVSSYFILATYINSLFVVMKSYCKSQL